MLVGLTLCSGSAQARHFKHVLFPGWQMFQMSAACKSLQRVLGVWGLGF